MTRGPWSPRNLPPFPAVATRLMNLLARERVSFKEVSDLLLTDAAFTAEVLRLANSPVMGGREVGSVLQAISILGVYRLRSLVTTLSLSKFLKPVFGRPAMKQLWRHNLACAVLAERCAGEFCCDPEDGYLAGLLHDLGRLAMMVCRPDDYSALLERAAGTTDEQRDQERELFGLDHCEVGTRVAAEWRLPAPLGTVMAEHHNPSHAAVRSVIGLVECACGLSDRLGFPAAGAAQPWSDDWLRARLTVRAPLPEDPAEFALLVAEKVNVLECEYALAS